MTLIDPERMDAKAKAIAEALGRLGEPITESQVKEQAKDLAAREACEFLMRARGTLEAQMRTYLA